MWPWSRKRSKKHEAIAHVELSQAICISSEIACELIGKVCSNLNVSGSTYSAWFKHDWLVRRELLAFMLQVVDRYAFKLVGPARRAQLLDFVGPTAAMFLIESYDFSGAPEGFDTKAWKDQANADCLEVFNDAARDYGECELFLHDKLGSPLFDNKFTAFTEEENVFGKMTSRVCCAAGEGCEGHLRTKIGMSVLFAITEQKLFERVEKTCKSAD